MSLLRLDRTAPELVALCGSDWTGKRRIVGWAMLVAERVVAYVPEHPGIAGGTLLNTYSSLNSVDERLRYAGIRPVRDWAALLDASAAGR